MDGLRARPHGTARPGAALLLLTAAAVALAACGGGAGGSSGGGVPGLHSGGHIRAAGSVPIVGSVTQSSDRSAGVTANAVNVTLAASGGEFTPTIRSPGWGFENLPVAHTEEYDINGTVWRSMTVQRLYGDGSKRGVVALTDADPAAFDDDYLVMGYWLRVPARFLDAEGNIDQSISRSEWLREIEYGAYANGGDPFEQTNLLALEGSATYTGDATAIYIHVDQGKTSDLIAPATLTASFGTNAQLGTIQGTVTGFQRAHNDSPKSHELTDSELSQLGAVTLGTADIGDSDSGFFTGDTTMTADGDSLTGKWGGQFFGNGTNPTDRPGTVAGTFGATDGQKAVVGTYAARSR